MLRVCNHLHYSQKIRSAFHRGNVKIKYKKKKEREGGGVGGREKKKKEKDFLLKNFSTPDRKMSPYPPNSISHACEPGGSRGRGTVGSIRARLLWAGTQLCYGCVITASELKEMETLTLWNLFRSWWWLNWEALTKESFQQVFGIWSAARSFH